MQFLVPEQLLSLFRLVAPIQQSGAYPVSVVEARQLSSRERSTGEAHKTPELFRRPHDASKRLAVLSREMPTHPCNELGRRR